MQLLFFYAVLETGFLLVANGVAARSESSAAVPRRSPRISGSFQHPLPVPQVKTPLISYTNPETGVPIDFYELHVREFGSKFYPNLGSGTAIGYDGAFPGPTFRVEKGRETVVRVVNEASRSVNLHLHGSYTRSPWDGWAKDGIQPGEYKDYYYPNQANSRTLWYHDHSENNNAMNMYRGLFGLYQIVDPKRDAHLGIPTTADYDIPLLFTSHFFTATGDLTDESAERASIYGDTWLANGVIHPYLDVEPRKYRFRVLNAAVSRSLNLTLERDGVPVEMVVVASDGGFRQFPVATKSLVTGMGERWEIIVDFAQFAGQRILARATNMWSDQEYKDSDKIMQFRVGRRVSNNGDNAPLPLRLNISAKFPTDRVAATREFSLVSHMDMMWGINNFHMDDPMKRVLMRPPLGTIEKYVLKSAAASMGMMDGSSNGNMMGGSMMGSGHMTSQGAVASGKGSGHHSGGNGASNGMMSGDMMGGGMMGHHGGMMSMVKTKTKRQVGLASAILTVKEVKSKLEAGLQRLIRRQMGGGMTGGMMGGMMGNGMMGNGMMGSGMMNMGNSWTHAIHFHLVDLRIISRRKNDSSKADGRDRLEPYEKDSVKDIVLFGSNEVVEVLLKFQPYPGVYMWHCHNAVHEDGGMMAVMNISRLHDFGYDVLDTRLEEPMDRRFRPKQYSGTDLENVKTTVLPDFAKLKAYPDPESLAAMEDRYWSSRGTPSADGTGAKGPVGLDPGMRDMTGSGSSHMQHHSRSTMRGRLL